MKYINEKSITIAKNYLAFTLLAFGAIIAIATFIAGESEIKNGHDLQKLLSAVAAFSGTGFYLLTPKNNYPFYVIGLIGWIGLAIK